MPDDFSANSLAGFLNADVGSPQLAGSARRAETGWDVIAGGVDIWEKSDQFYFVYKPLNSASTCASG